LLTYVQDKVNCVLKLLSQVLTVTITSMDILTNHAFQAKLGKL